MANYKLKYAGEKIDELLTKIDNLGAGTDANSGTVKLSNATDSNSGVSDGVAATPKAVKSAYDAVAAVNETAGALSRKVEKNTSSISENTAAVSQLKADMNTKANKTDVLSLEEIQASTDLRGKIASASAISELNTAIANSGLKMDLLWTNASPASAFEKQTIQLDSRKYKFVYISYRRKASEQDYDIYYLVIKNGRYYTPSTDFDSNYRSLMRPTKADDYYVYFEPAYVNNTNDNNFMIPEMIYGVG